MRERTPSTLYEKCSAEGSFIIMESTDRDTVRAMLTIANVDWETVQAWEEKAPQKSGQWNAILKLGYDVLHTLAEAYLRFDCIKARTHECLFAYLCEKHPELEFHHEFFDSIRTVRNRSLYYGKPASYEDWKSVKLQLNLYIKTLRETIEKKLK